MKSVLILGAGRVGRRVAEQLDRNSEVTIVDSRPERLQALRERADVRTLIGNAEIPAVLDKAGASNADLVLAATSMDSVNLASCLMCSQRYDSSDVQKRIARIRNNEISSDSQLLKMFGVTQAFCPEQIVTDTLLGPITYPGIAHLLEFADKKAMIAEVTIDKSSATLGRNVAENETAAEDAPFKIVSILRKNEHIAPEPDTRLRHNDRVLIAAAAKHISKSVAQLRSKTKSLRRICIAGGGHIGLRLAQQLEEKYSVVLIEADRARCAFLSHTLDRSLVLHGDATDESLLNEEDIDGVDFFISVSNRDEINIMASLLAKKLGVARIATLINRRSYKPILDQQAIDIVISPSDLTIGTLLKHVRERSFEQIHSLSYGGELLEFVVHPAADKVLGHLTTAVSWPPGVMLCMIVRDAPDEQDEAEVIIPDDGTVIEDGDRLIIYASSSEHVSEIESLVSASPFN